MDPSHMSVPKPKGTTRRNRGPLIEATIEREEFLSGHLGTPEKIYEVQDKSRGEAAGARTPIPGSSRELLDDEFDDIALRLGSESNKPQSSMPRKPVVLSMVSRLLPSGENDDWLEENLGYLADISGRSRRFRWMMSWLWAMPRYAYTVRTDRKKESA